MAMLRRFLQVHFGERAPLDLIQREVTARTFLVRTHADTVVFSHNTIMEFLVASRLARQLRGYSNADLYVRLLTDAINEFLVALLDKIDDEEAWLRRSTVDLTEMIRIPAEEAFDHQFGTVVQDFYVGRAVVTSADYLDFITANPLMTPPCSEGRELLYQLGNRPNVEWFVQDVDAYVEACQPLCWSVTDRRPPAGSEHLPVIYVSYYDAWAYCRWRGASLPTYAEWVKAGAWDTRAGHISEYPLIGDPLLGKNCNCASVVGSLVAVEEFPTAVSYAGCRHMLGNVAEWTRDWSGGGRTYLRIAGGGWSTPLDTGRSVHGSVSFPNVRRNFIGFRIVIRPPRVNGE